MIAVRSSSLYIPKSKIKRPPVDRPAAAAYLPIGLTKCFPVTFRRSSGDLPDTFRIPSDHREQLWLRSTGHACIGRRDGWISGQLNCASETPVSSKIFVALTVLTVLRTQSLLYQMELAKGKETGGSSPFMSIGPPLVPWSGDGASFAEEVGSAAVRLLGRRGPFRLCLCPISSL